jgi:hypothetical protein
MSKLLEFKELANSYFDNPLVKYSLESEAYILSCNKNLEEAFFLLLKNSIYNCNHIDEDSNIELLFDSAYYNIRNVFENLSKANVLISKLPVLELTHVENSLPMLPKISIKRYCLSKTEINTEWFNELNKDKYFIIYSVSLPYNNTLRLSEVEPMFSRYF